MWLLFAFDVVIALVLFFLPGFLVLKGFGLSSFRSVAFAPVVSAATLYLYAYVLLLMGIPSSWELVVLPVLILCLVVFLIGCLARRNSIKRRLILQDHSKQDSQRLWMYLGIYVSFALLVGLVVFVKTLDGAASFNQQYDNYAHLSMIRQFIETGFFAQANLLGYPSSWYNIVSLIASIGQQQVSVAVNACNYVIACVVFPSGMCALMSIFFEKRKLIMLSGAICAVAFTEFPWGLLVFGPLYPNFFGYAILPAMMSIFVLVLTSSSIKQKAIYGALFILGCLALVFMHPNTVFAGVVLLTPFVCAQILKHSKHGKVSHGAKVKKVGLVSGFIILVVVLWSVCFNLPAFQGVVHFNWPAFTSMSQAFANILFLAFTQFSYPQYLLAILVLIGIGVCFIKREHRWMAISYICALVILFVAIGTEGFLKQYLAGFWYTDSYRIAAMTAIGGIPLAAIGLGSIIELLSRLVANAGLQNEAIWRLKIVSLLFITLFVFSPNLKVLDGQDIITPFGEIETLLNKYNTLGEEAVYDASEVEFVEKAKTITGDAKVLNVPFDGSFLSYGINGFPIAYKDLETRGYWDGVSDLEGALVRAELDDYENDENVKQAVKDSGAQYVLLLDADDVLGERMYPCAKDLAAWEGIMNVTEDTPGFELMLSEGDMRLYKLTDL